jgi:hypothetical protein
MLFRLGIYLLFIRLKVFGSDSGHHFYQLHPGMRGDGRSNFLGEEIGIEQLIGGLVIIAGVMLVTLSGRSLKGSNSQEGPLTDGKTSLTAFKKAEIG